MTSPTRKANKDAKRSSPIPTTSESNNLASKFFSEIQLKRVDMKQNQYSVSKTFSGQTKAASN